VAAKPAKEKEAEQQKTGRPKPMAPKRVLTRRVTHQLIDNTGGKRFMRCSLVHCCWGMNHSGSKATAEAFRLSTKKMCAKTGPCGFATTPLDFDVISSFPYCPPVA
jgi:hypothetical protein